MADLVVLQFGVLLLVGALTPASALFPHQGDVLLYYQDGQRAAAGLLPYRDFPFEYPPLAILPMVLPHLVWPFPPLSFETFQWLHLLQNGLLSTVAAVTAAWVATRFSGRRSPVRVLVSYALLVVAGAISIAWRFDILPAVLSLLGVAAVVSRRPALAGTLLGAGFLAKVYPAVLLPLIAALYVAERDYRGLARLVAGFTFVSLSVLLLFAALAPDAAFSFLEYQQARPLQIESVLSGFTLMSRVLTGAAVQIVHDFGSVGVSSELGDALLVVQPALTVIIVGGTVVAGFLRFRAERRRLGAITVETLVGYAAAVVIATIVTNKVFSVQYVVWVIPLAALLPRPKALLITAICAMSVLIHPLNYVQLIALETPMVMVLNLRNIALLALFAWLLHDLWPTGVEGRETVDPGAPVGPGVRESRP